MALKQQDDFAEAERALRQACALDASLRDAPFTLGVLLWQTGRGSEALQWFDTALAIDRRFADAHYMRGLVLREAGEAAAALEALQEAVALRPSSADAHLSLARALQQQGQPEAAAAALATATRLSKLKSDAQASTFAVGVGRARLRARDIDGAIAQFREAVQLAADNPHAHYQLALALRAHGDLRDAARHFDEASRLAPYLRPPPDM
jgi:tetratricopeptide (TPR) repeat protein